MQIINFGANSLDVGPCRVEVMTSRLLNNHVFLYIVLQAQREAHDKRQLREHVMPFVVGRRTRFQLFVISSNGI